MFVLAEVVVSEFGEPSSQEGPNIPQKAKTLDGHGNISVYHGQCLRTAWSNFQMKLQPRTIYFDVGIRHSIHKHLLNGSAFNGFAPLDRIASHRS